MAAAEAHSTTAYPSNSTSSSSFTRLDTSTSPDAYIERETIGNPASAVTSKNGSKVESPSTSNPTALARFEFEPGRNKEGTKILMVEWEDDDNTRNIRGDWHISWEGKSTVLPARDHSSLSNLHRLYFLLGPGAPIPSIVNLTFNPKPTTTSSAYESSRPVIWTTNPLPAIFPPQLGASALESGKKGVLHTIWGKKRLSELQAEIAAESERNVEGVALQMALQEKEWIEQNFGLAGRRPSTQIMTSLQMSNIGQPGSPTSPRSPGGGRLAEKLKGLKLGTSEKALSPIGRSFNESQNPLSPEDSDVAVGSFASIKGSMGPKPSQRATNAPPPNNQGAGGSGMASLNAVAAGDASAFSVSKPVNKGIGRVQDEDDLFASPIGPRSPEMGKSPFSFKREDTSKYLDDAGTTA
ncbi:MAG: hypothetical protein M1820_005037 [Bogoriella megaspora]|nr:MAG: hypothetical protein M1820_005037 [Bogoriella megaspora]